MKPFWTCWVEGSNGGYGYRHPTFEGAKVEAARLSELPENKGKKVFVLQAIGWDETPVNERWHWCEYQYK